MKKKKIYLILAILTTLFLLNTAAVCNQCLVQPEEEIVEEAEEEPTVEETAEEVEEAVEEEPPEDEEEEPTEEKTKEETAKEEPTEETEDTDKYLDWKIYTNDIYGYEFKYPEDAEISEAYEDKSCVTITYKLGYIIIFSPAREIDECGGRTGVCSEYETMSVEEKLIIDGEEYLSKGVELTIKGETLDNHGEFLRLSMKDGTGIEYGSINDEVATYQEYLQIKETLIEIIESYRKVARD